MVQRAIVHPFTRSLILRYVASVPRSRYVVGFRALSGFSPRSWFLAPVLAQLSPVAHPGIVLSTTNGKGPGQHDPGPSRSSFGRNASFVLFVEVGWPD